MARSIDCIVKISLPIDTEITDDYLREFITNSPGEWRIRKEGKHHDFYGIFRASECEHSVNSLKELVIQELIEKLNPRRISGMCGIDLIDLNTWYTNEEGK